MRTGEAREITIGFEQGVPVSPRRPGAAAARADRRAQRRSSAAYGWGRLDMVENRRVGIKSRETYEAPAGLALIMAHVDLESICLERDLFHEKQRLEGRYADLVYDGFWYSPLKQALDAFVDESQRFVTGEVRLRLEPGRCYVVGRRSEYSLYDYGLATYEADDAFNHEDSEGFVKLWGLGVQTWAAKQASASRDPGRATGSMSTLWHGRFEGGPAEELLAFTVSLPFDQRLAADDLDRVARPRARAWSGPACSPSARPTTVLAALDQVEEELTDDDASPSCPSDEDIHTAVERRVTELAGPAGAKLHTGRSRNDQVATDLRLFTKRELVARRRPGARAASRCCSSGPRRPARPTCPATPTCSGPSRCCWPTTCWPTAGRCPATSTACSTPVAALDVSPLGAGALAGSSLALDPEGVAADLGFAAAFDNSLDAVSDRDFVAEALFDLDPGRRAPVADRRGGRALVHRGVRLPPAGRRLLHRQLDAPAEEEPRHRRAGPGQVRPAHRPPHRPAGHAEGAAARLQPRPAGGQGAAVRRARPGHPRARPP